MSDYRRGGFSSPFNTYSTWINNGNIDLTDTTKYRIDGSWLDNGEYGRAFKGIHSKKEVNIFLGAGYTNTSWSSTFLAGGIATAIRGLGLWGLSALFNRNKQPQQTSLQGNFQFPFQNYFTNLSGLFKINTPTSTNVTGNIDGGNVDKGKKPDDNDKDNSVKPNDDGKKSDNDGNKPVNDNNVNQSSLSATSTHKTSKKDIKGVIIYESAPANGQDYPETIVTMDTRENTKLIKDEQGNVKGNKYTYNFVEYDDDKKEPVYELVKAEIYIKESDKDKLGFTSIQYYADSNDFVKNSNGKYSVKPKTELGLSAKNPTNAAIRNTQFFDFENGQIVVFEKES